ncbi:aldehyde dehydrogenase family protein [Candidimonas humi]|uniref:Aldehyde dehydrogenase family protein n=1 Tax=Candidimonas humi TaxID=683355 RepID=A0ABV8P2V6_9BURK|nr:aldehyde dehydrogenase family protein [Candidimonas humi]MBV6303878.1 aldehyde dehydrogenase family protein [Candidimonas humi]
MSSEFITISPIDGQELLRRAYTSEAEIAAVLARARNAQRAWKHVPLAERCLAVGAAVERFVRDKDEIAEAITRQMGRPLRYTPGEVAGFEERARHMIAIAPQALAPLDLPPKEGYRRYIAREPMGVALTIAPWNYPLLTAVNSIVPALVAGNAVILKHSSQTPLCAEIMHRAFIQAGLPEGVFQYVHAAHATVQRMIQAPEVDYVSFTGSVSGGKAVEAAAAGRYIGTGLELGGNDPAYVRADADLAQAAQSVVDGAYFNSGQSCCGIQRIYVERRVYPEFVERAVALASQYVLGNPLDPATTLGPMVRASAAREVRGMLREALDKGARNLIDASRFGMARDDTAYMAPALLVDVDHGMSVMNQECFGPVAGIMPVDSDMQAVELMNDSPYGLSAAVFTRDTEAALRIGQHVETGTFFMNRCDYLDPALAWTGIKNSGRGVSLSVLGYEALTRAKSFHLRLL